MATKTPAEIAADKIETQRILREKGHFLQVARDNAAAKARALREDAESGVLAASARMVAESRHSAAMHDFQSGNALARAVEGYKVKRAVADLAMSEGKAPNGTNLPIVKDVAPSASGVSKVASDKAPEGWDKAETSVPDAQ